MPIADHPEGKTIFDPRPLKIRSFADSKNLSNEFIQKYPCLQKEDQTLTRQVIFLAFVQGMSEELLGELVNESENRSLTFDVLRAVFYFADEQTVRRLIGKQFTLDELRTFLHDVFLSETLDRYAEIETLIQKKEELEKQYNLNMVILEYEQKALKEKQDAYGEKENELKKRNDEERGRIAAEWERIEKDRAAVDAEKESIRRHLADREQELSALKEQYESIKETSGSLSEKELSVRIKEETATMKKAMDEKQRGLEEQAVRLADLEKEVQSVKSENEDLKKQIKEEEERRKSAPQVHGNYADTTSRSEPSYTDTVLLAELNRTKDALRRATDTIAEEKRETERLRETNEELHARLREKSAALHRETKPAVPQSVVSVTKEEPTERALHVFGLEIRRRKKVKEPSKQDLAARKAEQKEMDSIVEKAVSDSAYSKDQISFIMAHAGELSIENLKAICNPKIPPENMELLLAYWKRENEHDK